MGMPSTRALHTPACLLPFPDGRAARRVSPTDPWWAAVRLLTCFPAPRRTYPPTALVGSLIWFPLVGALLGALLGAVELSGRRLTGSDAVSCAAVVAVGLLCSRGAHLRGLMGIAGALFSGDTREKLAHLATRPAPTAFGILAGIGALLARYALLLAIPAGARLWVLVASAGLSRGAIVWASWRFGYAEVDTAIAGYLGAMAGPRDLLLVLPVIGVAFGTLGPLSGAAVLGSTWLATHLLAVWISRPLGGLTASTYEAVVEVGELAALTTVAGLAQVGQT